MLKFLKKVSINTNTNQYQSIFRDTYLICQKKLGSSWIENSFARPQSITSLIISGVRNITLSSIILLRSPFVTKQLQQGRFVVDGRYTAVKAPASAMSARITDILGVKACIWLSTIKCISVRLIMGVNNIRRHC